MFRLLVMATILKMKCPETWHIKNLGLHTSGSLNFGRTICRPYAPNPVPTNSNC